VGNSKQPTCWALSYPSFAIHFKLIHLNQLKYQAKYFICIYGACSLRIINAHKIPNTLHLFATSLFPPSSFGSPPGPLVIIHTHSSAIQLLIERKDLKSRSQSPLATIVPNLCLGMFIISGTTVSPSFPLNSEDINKCLYNPKLLHETVNHEPKGYPAIEEGQLSDGHLFITFSIRAHTSVGSAIVLLSRPTEIHTFPGKGKWKHLKTLKGYKKKYRKITKSWCQI